MHSRGEFSLFRRTQRFIGRHCSYLCWQRSHCCAVKVVQHCLRHALRNLYSQEHKPGQRVDCCVVFVRRCCVCNLVRRNKDNLLLLFTRLPCHVLSNRLIGINAVAETYNVGNLGRLIGYCIGVTRQNAQSPDRFILQLIISRRGVVPEPRAKTDAGAERTAKEPAGRVVAVPAVVEAVSAIPARVRIVESFAVRIPVCVRLLGFAGVAGGFALELIPPAQLLLFLCRIGCVIVAVDGFIPDGVEVVPTHY